MTIGVEDLDQVLELFQRSDFDELRLEVDDFKVHVRRNGAGEPVLAAARPVETEVAEQIAAPVTPPAAPTAPAPAAPDAAAPEGAIAIRAEVSGVFYRAPSPSADAFVEKGARVAAGDTVGLIEVMKLFTSVVSPGPGEIVRIVVDNAAPVQVGDIIMYVRS